MHVGCIFPYWLFFTRLDVVEEEERRGREKKETGDGHGMGDHAA